MCLHTHGLITVVLAHLETRIDQKDYVRKGEGLRLSRFVTQKERDMCLGRVIRERNGFVIALFITNRIPIVIIKNCLLQSAPPLIFLALFILNNELVSTQLVCCLYLGGLDCYSPPTGRLLYI